jgi:hypothetical protein
MTFDRVSVIFPVGRFHVAWFFDQDGAKIMKDCAECLSHSVSWAQSIDGLWYGCKHYRSCLTWSAKVQYPGDQVDRLCAASVLLMLPILRDSIPTICSLLAN